MAAGKDPKGLEIEKTGRENICPDRRRTTAVLEWAPAAAATVAPSPAAPASHRRDGS